MKNAFDEKILDEADQWLEQNKKVILATVVQPGDLHHDPREV